MFFPPVSLAQDAASRSDRPLRLAIVGLVHGHVSGFLDDVSRRTDVEMVGIYDLDKNLIDDYAERFNLDQATLYSDLEQLLDKAKPEAVAVFSNTFDHASIVEMCARRGIHVMMEKPLAVNMNHARRIHRAAGEGNIQVIVNFETTWYPSTYELFDRTVTKKEIGDITKIIVRDGHQGPKEINVQPEFLVWLVDPERNGGGALTDFGCYGAILMTWLLDGQRPVSVSAVTQQLKTDPVYERVDDETTILVEYPNTIGIIQASWNWPFNRKDIDVYGRTGAIYGIDRSRMEIRKPDNSVEEFEAQSVKEPYNDTIAYLKAVVRGEIEPDGPSNLDLNIIATEILDAARKSAATGNKVSLSAP